jgi:hypothetical protein
MACVMILSDKSSGSSILQKELSKHPKAQSVEYTRHFETETLFWVKAAAVLGLPQDAIHSSEVPFDMDFAAKDLTEFLNYNLPGFEFESLNKKTIFAAWTALGSRFGPLFIEKSPHHLHVRTALSLLSEYIASDTPELKFIGIIRNPMDTLYSSWKRWGADPDLCQYDWLRAYQNLMTFSKRHADRCIIIRYEDFVSDSRVLSKICSFLGIDKNDDMGSELHGKSQGKWKKDKFFGFRLAPEVYEFAFQFDYRDINTNSRQLWFSYKFMHTAKIKVKQALNRANNQLKA